MQTLFTLKGINKGKVIIYQFASQIQAKYIDSFGFTRSDSIHTNRNGSLSQALEIILPFIHNDHLDITVKKQLQINNTK